MKESKFNTIWLIEPDSGFNFRIFILQANILFDFKKKEQIYFAD
jgi:hypothetical protein